MASDQDQQSSSFSILPIPFLWDASSNGDRRKHNDPFCPRCSAEPPAFCHGGPPCERCSRMNLSALQCRSWDFEAVDLAGREAREMNPSADEEWRRRPYEQAKEELLAEQERAATQPNAQEALNDSSARMPGRDQETEASRSRRSAGSSPSAAASGERMNAGVSEHSGGTTDVDGGDLEDRELLAEDPAVYWERMIFQGYGRDFAERFTREGEEMNEGFRRLAERQQAAPAPELPRMGRRIRRQRKSKGKGNRSAK
ncbi:hypothetical protein MBM_04763 [Drepanopeziza brunnea f. sp. 'multigermtubi' MB_m1]|uniref:Uncharacterized protein n=1 Tax=Marssonina brunnea f. sp. multigermtubi (strain MB_m1) TaxID=1072389 RepID=K1WW09_MARBU|nr:uncharacterized protein MBM_04763 [Drepanopeziza brunnea f. sp. 'multigermtubi' MB_m1]EKD17186.1 hypothetical protein MBM_04763 [Drepanopeziza brunnea f. sp. 'multigermtubi' MB_m1]